MANSIRKAISPLLTLSRVVGLGTIEYPPGQPRLCLTLLYISVLWSIYVVGLWHVLPVFLRKLVYRDSIYLPRLWLNALIMLMSTIMNLYNGKKFEACLKRITAVDETFQGLGVSEDYPKQYKTTLRLVLVWFCFTIFSVLGITYYITWDTTLPFFDAVWIVWVPNSVFFLESIVDLQFGNLLGCTSIRLNRLNECIKKSVDSKPKKRGLFQERLCSSSRNPINDSIDEKNKRMLWTAMHLHSEICKISRALNAQFEIQISFEMIAISLTLVVQFVHLYRLNVVLRKGILHTIVYIFVNAEWVAMHFAKLYYVNNACDKASAKANSTKGFIDEAIDTLPNAEDRKDMMQFIFQIMLKPLKFTGLGLFYLGHNLMRRILTSVVTVVIIMLQMDIVPHVYYNLQNKCNNGTDV